MRHCSFHVGEIIGYDFVHHDRVAYRTHMLLLTEHTECNFSRPEHSALVSLGGINSYIGICGVLG